MSGEGNGAVSTPGEFKQLSRTKVTLPNLGKTVEIRKLIGWDFIEIGQLPLISTGTVSERAEAVRKKVLENPAIQQQAVKQIVLKGVVSPRILDVDPRDCPDDAITVYDLGPDFNWLVEEIQKFSGLTGEETRQAGTFPQETGAPR